MNNFALIGAAGYVAPRHFKAIKETGNQVVSILDKSDSVGIIDSFFPDASFFNETERFDRHLYKLLKSDSDQKVDYVSICSPNYLHDAHIRLALRNGAHAICEKPLVLNPWNFDGLRNIEQDTGKNIYHILQLRVHPSIIKLKEQLEQQKIHKMGCGSYLYHRKRTVVLLFRKSDPENRAVSLPTSALTFDLLIYLSVRFKIWLYTPILLGSFRIYRIDSCKSALVFKY